MTKTSSLFIQRTSIFNGINSAGKALNAIGLDPFKMVAESILEKAIKTSAYKGPIPFQLVTGLNILIESINEDAKPNPFGKLAAKRLFERTLHGRFKVEEVLQENRTIEESEIHEPVFIIGMPRTGTTILHALLHEDSAHRSPLAWECLLPHPVPKPETFNNNDQLNTIRKEFLQLFKLVPDFQRKHHMAADSPQECIGINALDFNTFQPAAQFYIPSYMDWFENKADKLSTMRFHKRFLQYLQSGGVKADKWLLKSPVHLMRLPEIFTVYPDAKIIMTHRPPVHVVASTSSLISSVRSLYSNEEDPVRTGHEQAGIWSRYFNRFLESRKILNKENQIIDLKFEDFLQDQMGTIRKIYERFNWHLSIQSARNMEKFLLLNPKDKNGIHYYTIEDFGLSGKKIEHLFSNYLEFLNDLDI